VNKADGELAAAAGRIAADYRSALNYLRRRSTSWEVPVETCSALENRGIAEVWGLIERFRSTMRSSGEIEANRAEQARRWLWNETAESLLELLKADPDVRSRIAALEAQVMQGSKSPRVAADELIRNFWQREREQ
jgi:LAO/AO transport system kinase